VNRSLSCLSGVIALGALFVLVPACEESTSSSPSPDSGITTGDGGGASECPAPTAGPTKHEGDVKDGEVWTAAGSPHIVEYDVNIREGATLTIEPCAEVRIAKERRINVAAPLTPNSGTLIAEGTPTKPIKFTSDGADRWGSIYVVAPGTARFSHVTFENGGGEQFEHGATLVAVGDDAPPLSDPVLFVDNVTIKKSRGTGVYLQRRSQFITGSKDLTVTESGDDEAPYPLEISEHAIDSLPTGKYTGNKKDEILIRSEGDSGAGTGLVEDATLHERGVPYHIGDSESDSLVIGSSDENQNTTLTIEPGVVMKFEPKTAFMVQLYTTEKPANAVVKAQGTADKPIVFTSASPTPKAGDWRGLWFGGIPQEANVLDHVRIEYAGYDCGCALNTCSNIESSEGAVLFSMQPSKAFITNTTFKEIEGHGIMEGFIGTLVDFRPTNTFEGVTGCVQTLPSHPTNECPDPRPACDGM
jgi:hypothetical protein